MELDKILLKLFLYLSFLMFQPQILVKIRKFLNFLTFHLGGVGSLMLEIKNSDLFELFRFVTRLNCSVRCAGCGELVW